MTAWGKLIRNPNVKDASSYHGKLFRRRFRVPYPVFEHLVDVCEEYNIFEIKRKDKVLIPISIKLLCCLRMLGRGNCADDIAEMAQVGESTVNAMFKVFCRNFRKVLQPIHIPTPDDVEILKVMDVYARLGLPGTVGSVDGTHVRWDQCPVRLRALCTGKEKFPTLGFQAVVDHSRRILHVTDAFYGSYNDKNLSNFDSFIYGLRKRTLYRDVEYSIYDEHGVPRIVKGVHVICDGGYQHEFCFMNPFQFRMSKQITYW